MRNTFLSAATVSALLFALVGVGATGRGGPAGAAGQPHVSASQTGNPSGTNARPDSKGQPKSAGDGTSGADKDDQDPLVKVKRFAQQEADVALKEEICRFLAEYGEPDPALAKAQANGAKPSNTFCDITAHDRGEGLETGSPGACSEGTSWPGLNPAVRPKVVIAVLPDPVHTQLALRFDESIDELQNSMQDLGWTYDRAWLPWDNKDHETAADFDKRMANKVGQESYEKSPGAILFRADPDRGTSQPLIVLVVGDTPTGGVEAVPFRNAISIWKQLTGWQRYQAGKSTGSLDQNDPIDASTLSILGPTYSGSVPSLKALLSEVLGNTFTPAWTKGDYPCPAKPFELSISSGTVTDATGINGLDAGSSNCRGLRVRVSSFAVDLHYEVSRLLQFLDHHHGFHKGSDDHCQVATVSEDESTFGNTRVVAGKEEISKLQTRIDNLNNFISNDPTLPPEWKTYLQQQENEAKNEMMDAKLEERMGACSYRFPREISKLRAAYEQNGVFGFSSGSTSTVRTQLHLSLGGSSREDDTVHTFSDTQGTAASEAEISQMAGELERMRIKVVLLYATDVLDEMFVTRYLAQHAPNVTVIVVDTDNLFLRGGDSSMGNTYVVGPWPLIPGNEEWSEPADSEQTNKGGPLPHARVHDSSGGQGLYAATRFLLCPIRPNPREDPNNNCGRFDPDHTFVSMREYQPPIATWAEKTNDLKAEPPLWLSAVGRGGFWPISLVDLDQADDKLPESQAYNLPRLMDIDKQKDGKTEVPLPARPSVGILEPTPLSIPIATGIIALLLIWHGMACFRARLDRGFAWSYALAHEQHHTPRNVLQIVITLATVPALVLLKTPIEAGVHIRTLPYTCINWALQVVVVVLALRPWLRMFGFETWAAIRSNRKDAALPCAAWLAIGAAYLAVANRFTWSLIAPSANRWPSERAFFFFRSGHLFCGSSPSLPVLLLGGALVVFLVSVFERLLFYQNFIPKLPDDSLGVPGPEKTRRLTELLESPLTRWNWAILGIAAMTLVVFVLCLQDQLYLRSLAHGRFDYVVIGMSAAVVLLLMYDMGTAIASWFLLRADCLLPLMRSPIRWGFTWIKGWSWKRLWAPGAAAEARFDYVHRLTETTQRWLKDPGIETASYEARRLLAQDPRDSAWATRMTECIGELNWQLARSATLKLAELKTLWSNDHGPITGSELHERGMAYEVPLEKLEPGNPPSAEWNEAHDRMAMEEFVALLYLGYIRMVLLQIRTRIITATGMYILLLWALTSYPFLNHHSIIIALTCLLIGLATSVIWMYSQMHRDEILSRTTEGIPGKLDTDFFIKILSMVGIPSLTLIASQFPEVSNTIFSWLEPGLSSIK